MERGGQLARFSTRIIVHHGNSLTRSAGEENFDELDNSLLQFVLGQEGLHESILDEAYGNQNHMRATASSDNSQSHYHQGESSTGTRPTSGVDEQIAFDFAYAMELQEEMERLNIEDDDICCVPSPSDTEDDDDDHEHNDEEADRQDDNEDSDPDNMTYEQRQALVESVGTEARGLSDELISFLEPWKYKASGHEKCSCPICLNTFKRGASLITLPCRHNYHRDCVIKWLKIEKTCPVCKYEVFGPC